MKSSKKTKSLSVMRYRFILGVMLLAAVALSGRMVSLQVLDRDFLKQQGDARTVRVESVPAHRGMILDRYGEPLALSTPVQTVWADPQTLSSETSNLPALAALLELPTEELQARLARHATREFMYLKRRLDPDVAEQVQGLGIPGVHLMREYRRYYPAGEVSAHVLGLTNIDDHGQEGVELAYNEWLQGLPGKKRVMRDRLGRTIKDLESIKEPRAGNHLHLSLDYAIQYLAYRELKVAVQRNQAESGSVVVLDVHTGEVLAMANQPSFNPNSTIGGFQGNLRNRAVTDLFEPGSTIKPFSIAAALESGVFTPDAVIDTSPGRITLANYTIRDARDYGKLDMANLIEKSSNVGMIKLAQALPPEKILTTYQRLGLGMNTGSGFPGERIGNLPSRLPNHPVEQAALSYGYGLSVTALQLAQAYTAIAAEGIMPSISLLRVDKPATRTQALDPGVARQVLMMMEAAVAEGTGTRAQVPGYRVAGKTGTARKASGGGYAEDKYIASFVGIAPASAPRFVVIVVINDPQADHYSGSRVAAPVAGQVMGGVLRLLNIMPDAISPKEKEAAPGVPPAMPSQPSPPVQWVKNNVRTVSLEVSQ